MIIHEVFGIPINANIWIGTNSRTLFLERASASYLEITMPKYLIGEVLILRVRKAGKKPYEFIPAVCPYKRSYGVIEHDYT